MVRALTVRRLFNAIGAYTAPPHRLMMRDGSGDEGAYAWIVNHGLEGLEPFVWVKSKARPMRRYGEWKKPGLPVLRMQPARRRAAASVPDWRGKLRVSYSARRSAAQG